MRIKLRYNKDVVCAYLEGETCCHPRCYRLRFQECKYYHNAEKLSHGQITLKFIPRVKYKEKYSSRKHLRGINYGENKVR